MDERDPFDDGDLVGPPPTPDTLREIVARHRRGRTRALTIALVGAIIAGPLAGWAIGHSGRGGTTQVATGSPGTTGYELHQQKSAGGAAIAPYPGPIPVPNGVKPRRLFTRTTADGITIRAYRSDPPTPAPADATSTSVPAPKAPTAYACVAPSAPAPSPEAGRSTGGAVSSSGSSAGGSSPAPGTEAVPPQTIDAPPVASPRCPVPVPCTPSPSLITELSNTAAVGQGFASLTTDGASRPVTLLSTGEFGVAEDAPVTWIGVQTGNDVKTVRLRLPSGATDEMTPVDGVAVLALNGWPLPGGWDVEALDASGKVLGGASGEEAGGGGAGGVSGQPGVAKALVACGIATGSATAVANSGASATANAVSPRTPPTTR